MIDAKAYFFDQFQTKVGNAGLVDEYLQQAVEKILGDDHSVHNGLVSLLQKKEEQIITSPEIDQERDKFCQQVLLGLSRGLSDHEEAQCLQGLQAVSNVLFVIFINKVILDSITGLDNLSIRERPGKDSQYMTYGEVAGKKFRKEVSFGNKRTKAQAAQIILTEREKLLGGILEKKEKIECKKPNLKIARNLVKKGVLIEYEDRKFKVSGLQIEDTPYEGSSKMLRLRHMDIQGGSTSRSLDIHDFQTAYIELTDLLSKLYGLEPLEINEIKKFSTRFLYTQKTSQK